MADPVSSMDVEDVLSSIRRLVSEEAKNGAEAAPPVVAEVKTTEEEAVLEAEEQQKPAAETKKPTKRPARTARPKRPQLGVPPSNEISKAEAEAVQETKLSDIARSPEPEPEAGQSDQKLVLTAELRVAEDDGHEVSASDEPAPDPSAKEDRRGTARPKPFQFSSDDTLFERASKEMDALKGEGEEEPAMRRPKPAPEPEVEAPVQSGEAKAKKSAKPQEDADEIATDGDAGVSAADEQPMQALAGAVPDVDEFSLIAQQEDEGVLDEETLRDMISEMVREELQGELGDRITRNVRKLVRREIQRSLAGREFE